MFNKRVSVLNPDGSPTMPTKASRARRWIRDGKAKVVQNDLQVFCVQLVEEPTGRNTQDISLGIDPGSCFTGVAVQSKQVTLIGLNLNLPKKKVQKRLTERAVLRRTRRGRRIKRSLPCYSSHLVLTLLDLKARGFLAQPVGLLADVTTNE